MIITGWPSTKDELHSDLRSYWSYRDDPGSNRWRDHEGQVHNHTSGFKTTSVGSAPSKSHGVSKKKLLTQKSIYWVDINTDIEKHIRL